MAKKWAKNGRFLAMEGRILTLFHNFSQITSKYAQKHHIKNKIKFALWKIFKSKKLRKNGQKRAKNCRFLALEGRILRKSKKGLDILLLFTQEKLYTKFQKIWLIWLRENALGTDGRTDGRMDGNEIIGPSRKIPGTNDQGSVQSLNLQSQSVPNENGYLSSSYAVRLDHNEGALMRHDWVMMYCTFEGDRF